MAKKIIFTCTEHFGNEDINLLILEPLVNFINASYGREVVKIRDEFKEEVVQLVRRINQATISHESCHSNI